MTGEPVTQLELSGKPTFKQNTITGYLNLNFKQNGLFRMYCHFLCAQYIRHIYNRLGSNLTLSLTSLSKTKTTTNKQI